MKKFILPIAAVAFSIVACHQSSSSTVASLDAKHFAATVDSLQDEQLIDVRTSSEFSTGHIDGAKNIDWNGSDFAEQAKLLDKNKPVMVYCLSGGRSQEAANFFKTEGFSNVIEMEKGIVGWKSENLPLTAAEKVETPTESNETVSTAAYYQMVNSQKVVLVDFSAVWCGPCQRLKPRLEELEKEMGSKFRLVKLDSDRDAKCADSMKITALPTLILYKSGKEIWRNEGLLEKQEVADQINNAAK